MSVYATEIPHIVANLVLLQTESGICGGCLVGNLPAMFSNNFRILLLLLNISLGVCAARGLIDFTTQSLVEQILEDVVFN